MTQQHYDKYSIWYDKQRNDGFYPLINEMELDVIKPYIQNKRVLEVGCGTGIILEKVQEYNPKELKAIDFSSKMVKIAKKKGFDVIQSDVLNLPYKDKSFDIVYSFKVLPHVKEIIKAINEIKRVTNNNGRIFIEFYNPYSFKALSVYINGLFRKRGVYIRHDTLSKILFYIKQAKLKQVHVYGFRAYIPLKFVYQIKFLKSIFNNLEKNYNFVNISSYILIECIKNDN